VDKEHRRDAIENRRRHIYEVGEIPTEIKGFQKANKSLTKTERFMSAFLQSCIRYGYIRSYRSQQVIRLGNSDQYIISDFFLHYPEVIIEVDGLEHQTTKDTWRDNEVYRLFDYKTIRVKNQQVVRNNKVVRTMLLRELAKAEGLSTRKIRERIKEYWKFQTNEGFI
jgi:very-short-patch-repair endonuclease